ncbi:MAG: hypothetical protein AB7I37_17645 [Pirellulales bacterium]
MPQSVTSQGVTQAAKSDRRHLLAENMDQLIKAMKESGIVNPVGIVVDATDRLGSALYGAALLQSGMTEEQARQQLADTAARMAEQNQFPTALLVVSWKVAEQLLPMTSPTAKKNLREIKSEYQIGWSGRYLVIGIGSGGNSYGVTEIPDMPRPVPTAHDGQHRFKGIHLPTQINR